jgi:hypothetical protein
MADLPVALGHDRLQRRWRGGVFRPVEFSRPKSGLLRLDAGPGRHGDPRERRGFLPKTLPGDWQRTPVSPGPRKFGDKFLDSGRYPAMRVPSVVILGEFNFVLNPLQARFADLKIGHPEIFQFDPRVID